MHARVGHAQGIGLVDFGFEEADEERKQDFGEDGVEFVGLVGGGGEGGREQRALQAGEGLVPHLAAGVDALGGEGVQDREPVRLPCWIIRAVSLMEKERSVRRQGDDSENGPSICSRWDCAIRLCTRAVSW